MTHIILFDMMDTLVREPYFDAVRGLLAAREDLHAILLRHARRLWPRDPDGRPEMSDADACLRLYFECRNRESYIAFECGAISEYEHFREFYRTDLDAELLAALPSGPRVKKRMFRQPVLLEGMRELLHWLRAIPGVRLAIASNYSHWYQEYLNRLEELGTLFDYYFISCEMGVRKPAEAYFNQIESNLNRVEPGIGPGDFFFADDRAVNLEPARQRGWWTFQMGTVAALRAALERFLDRRGVEP
ncbi:MAG: HAD-IA family hydrolase [Leptospiraceae bacterium]|nr:HAD-IA family hydrolase [Leptospiraceae bacterium]MCB1317709.1 HAD-IA family hydrolase [Leptospiraceae bacterium]MCB1323291.1 HAD-IA family hydrolase [Leptospiraceae bacterium]